MANSDAGFAGFQRPGTAASEYNTLKLMIDGMLSRVRTATLVKVMAVTNSGGVSPVGFVDILPMVNQVDGIGQATEHLTIYKCPYLRVQGGANAIILDPQVGDIGIAVFADRDISSATANKGQANPSSSRRFSMADGLYLGGVLNGLPTQYTRYSSTGIEIHSPTQVKISAPDVLIEVTTLVVNASASVTITTPTFTVNGATVMNGTVVGSSTITAPDINGTVNVTDAVSTMGTMRTKYNAHKGHGAPGTGNTPDQTM